MEVQFTSFCSDSSPFNSPSFKTDLSESTVINCKETDKDKVSRVQKSNLKLKQSMILNLKIEINLSMT